MSAKAAARALVEHDEHIKAAVERVTVGVAFSFENLQAREAVVREAFGTWTLTLAADAAGVTEEQVLAALARIVRCGTLPVCQGLAKNICRGES